MILLCVDLYDYMYMFMEKICLHTIKRMAKQYISILKINMTKASIEFRGRKIDETRNYLLDEKKHDLMCKKYKKTCKYLNYVEHLLILASTITGCISIFAFTSLSWFLLVLRIN